MKELKDNLIAGMFEIFVNKNLKYTEEYKQLFSENLISKRDDFIFVGTNDEMAHLSEVFNAFEVEKFNISTEIIGKDKICLCWETEVLPQDNFYGVKILNKLMSVQGSYFYSVNNGLVSHLQVVTDAYAKISEKRKDIKLHEAIKKGNYNRIIEGLKQGIYKALSRREIEVLAFWSFFDNFKEVAKILDISNRTVGHYLENVRSKLHCRNRRHLIEQILDTNSVELFVEMIRNRPFSEEHQLSKKGAQAPSSDNE